MSDKGGAYPMLPLRFILSFYKTLNDRSVEQETAGRMASFPKFQRVHSSKILHETIMFWDTLPPI